MFKGGKWPESMQEFNHDENDEPPPTLQELYEEVGRRVANNVIFLHWPCS